MSGEHNLWLSWWVDSDWVLRGVFVLLTGLSVLSWTVIVYKSRQIAGARRREREYGAVLGAGSGIAAWAERSNGEEASRRLYEELHELAAAHRDGAIERASVEAKIGLWMRGRRIGLESYLAVLATIGNASPFIGLFGTVWGIMHALQALGGAQMLSLQMVAGPVAEALVSTAAGLFAAIPAVMAYNFFVRRLRTVSYLVEQNGNAMLDAVLFERRGAAPAERRASA